MRFIKVMGLTERGSVSIKTIIFNEFVAVLIN